MTQIQIFDAERIRLKKNLTRIVGVICQAKLDYTNLIFFAAENHCLTNDTKSKFFLNSILDRNLKKYFPSFV